MKKLSLSAEEIRALREFHVQAKRHLGSRLIKLALFGSKLQGRNATRESDIDILILVRSASAELREKILDMAFDVNLKYGVYISPRIISRSIYNHLVWRMTSFIQTLKEKSVAI